MSIRLLVNEFIEFPYVAIEYYSILDEGIGSYVWLFSDFYQPFMGLIDANLVKIVGSIFYIVLALLFINTKKIENIRK